MRTGILFAVSSALGVLLDFLAIAPGWDYHTACLFAVVLGLFAVSTVVALLSTRR